MIAPLAASYRESVLWLDTATPHVAESRLLPDRADVVIVGAGYCGLAAGAELGRRGRHAVVIDGEELGWGASTRNGGMVIPELKHGPRALERRYGPLGVRMHAAVEEAFDFVETVIADESIDCDYQRTGQLYLAHNRPTVAALHELADEHSSIGHTAPVVTGDELSKEIGSTSFAAGLVLERTGGLHPARFHAGLARVADTAGAELHPHTRALVLERGRGATTVVTNRGQIEAGEVLLATNAYADSLEPRLAQRVLPMGSFIIATEPVDHEFVRDVSPRGRMMFDSKYLLWYWRFDPDGRMVFGGRRRLGRVRLAEARDHLYGAMVGVHPQLAGVRVERAWGGQVALTVDRLPHVGRIDGVWYATGCNGSGVALNTWLGHQLAGAICGEPPPPFAELAHPVVPLYRARALYLPVVSTWMRWKDSRR
jgi:glycine/D-amino acid oxidase-like deaminating enzyme